MIEIKVYEVMEGGEGEKQVEMRLEGDKLEIMTEFTHLIKGFVEGALTPTERGAFITTLLEVV